MIVLLLLAFWFLTPDSPGPRSPAPRPATEEAVPDVTSTEEDLSPDRDDEPLEPQESAESSLMSLTGFVRSELDGTGIPGAIVEAHTWHSDNGLETAVTDDRGAFSLRLAPYQSVELRVRHRSDFVTATEAARWSQWLDPRQQWGPIELLLAPGRLLTGVVLDEEGSPVANAKVELFRYQKSFADLRTDPEGQFTLRALHEESGHLVAQQDELGYSEEFHVDEATEEESIELILDQPFAAIEGVVRDERGVPVPRARVERIDYLRNVIEGTTADSDGEFAFRQISDHRGRGVSAAPPDSRRGKAWVQVSAIPGETIWVELTALQRGDLSISGVALTADDTPLPRVALWVSGPIDPATGEDTLSSTTSVLVEPDGKFDVHGLHPGNYRIQASGDSEFIEDVIVPAGSEGVRIPLVPKWTVRGTVRDANTGSPIPTFFTANGTFGRLEERSSGSGTFTIPNVHRKTSSITIQAPGYQGREVELEPYRNSDQSQIDLGFIDLPPAQPLLIRVVDFEGQPVENVVIEESSRGFRSERTRLGRTNSQGELSIASLAHGTRTLFLEKPGNCGQKLDVDKIPATRVLKQFLPRRHDVTGYVSHQGQPMPGVVVDELTTDPAGRFHLSDICGGEQKFSFRGELGPTRFEWHVEKTVSRLTADSLQFQIPSGSGSLSVTTPGFDFPKTEIALFQAGPRQTLFWVQESSSAQFTDLEPGRYFVHAEFQGLESEDWQLEPSEVVVGDRTSEVVITPGPGEIHGMLTAPVPVTAEDYVSITMRNTKLPANTPPNIFHRWIGRKQLNSEGAFEWTGLPEGRFHLRALSYDDENEIAYEFQKTIDLTAGSPLELSIQLVKEELEDGEDE